MPQVWPFKPRTPWSDIYQWQTDVIRCHSAEQRISLRPDPRRELGFDHLFSPQQLASAQEIVRRFDEYVVPDWGQFQSITSIPSGSEVSIAVDPCIDWTGSDKALIWKSDSQYELLDVIYDSNGDLISDVISDWAGVYLMPAYEAIAPDRLAVQRILKTWASGSIRFDVQHVTESPASTYEQYRGIDVMTDCPKIAGGLDESLSWPYEIADNDMGIMVALRERSLIDATFSMRWREYTKCKVQSLRRWLMSRYGRQRAFWLSSRSKDLLPASGILSADTIITVSTLPGVLPLAQDQFDIELVTTAGTYYRRQVTEWALGAGSTIILTIDSALGANITAANIDRISFLRCVRLNSDRIEFIHHAAGWVQVSAPCIECPFPV